MSSERGQELLSQIADFSADLPYAPSLLAKLYSQTNQGALASLDDIALTISGDQGLTTRVLTIANSAYYGLNTEVTTPTRAIALLGLGEIRSLILSIGVRALISPLKDASYFDLQAYLRHQVLTAIAARLAATQLMNASSPAPQKAPDPDEMFTLGLLHDLGKALTALRMPQDWKATQQLTQDQAITQCEAEQQYWGIDHSLVGGMTLAAWQLPAQLSEPVSWHHAPLKAPEFVLRTKLLHLADALANQVDHPDTPISGPWETFIQELGLEDLNAAFVEEVGSEKTTALLQQLG